GAGAGLMPRAGAASQARMAGPTPQVRVEPGRNGGEGGATNINTRYTFANFIVGSANRLAHAASLSVAERPGHAYNPLFLYGGVGLGKTHLMHAIGNQVAAKFPRKRVVYATSEKFTNEFITSIQQGKIDDFRNRYRRIDLLLIDDIEFIARKVVSNIRELEGALNRIIAYASMGAMPISIELAQAVLSNVLYNPKKRQITPERIAKAVSEYYGVGLDALKGQKRDKAIVVPRQIAMFLMREETDVSLLRIGAELGGRDHSTVLHACDKITRESAGNDELRRDIAALRELIHAD